MLIAFFRLGTYSFVCIGEDYPCRSVLSSFRQCTDLMQTFANTNLFIQPYLKSASGIQRFFNWFKTQNPLVINQRILLERCAVNDYIIVDKTKAQRYEHFYIELTICLFQFSIYHLLYSQPFLPRFSKRCL